VDLQHPQRLSKFNRWYNNIYLFYPEYILLEES